MGVKTAFQVGLLMAIEETEGIAPNSSLNRYSFQGGRWISITTDEIPDIQHRQAQIFPTGYSGRRARNTRSPVAGRQWSDGTMNMPVTADFFPALLYAAMGSASVNRVPSTDAILGDTDLAAEASTFVILDGDPSDGGAILEFVITDASTGGHISVQGIDANGRGASEIISFDGAGTFHTRTSFSAIAPSSIFIYTTNSGSVTVNGVQYWDYTISENNVDNPTLSVERLGDPRAGATSKAFVMTKLGVQSLTMSIPAEQRDGIITTGVTLEGNPAATCDAGNQVAASAAYVWPSWGLKITRDNSNWFQVTNADLNYVAGVRNYRAAAGVQHPQGTVFGSRELTGNLNALVVDEAEYNRWLGLSSQTIGWEITSQRRLTTAQTLQMNCSMNGLFIENGSLEEDDDALTFNMSYRNVEDASDGLMKWNIKTNLPPTALGL